MIASIQIRGLGAHKDTSLTLDAKGHNTITGASEQGKTLLIDALCFVLYGWNRLGQTIDILAMRDDCDEINVEVVFDWGISARRILRRDKHGKRGKTTRILGEREYTTGRAWLGALNTIGKSPKHVRQVLVPMAWQALLGEPGNGRRFRDLLAEILPKADKAAIVRRLLEEGGHGWRDGDPINVQGAEMLRRRANRARDNAEGKVVGLAELVAVGDETTVSGPTKAEIEAAEAVVAVGVEWDAYDRAHDLYVEAVERAGFAEQAVAEWDTRFAALGDKPDGDTEAVSSAQETLDALRQEQQTLTFNVGQKQAMVAEADRGVGAAREHRHPEQSYSDAVNAAKRRHSDAIAAVEGLSSVCPTCGRPGWTEARTAAMDDLNSGRYDAEAAERARDARAAELLAEHETALNAALSKHEEAVTRLAVVEAEAATVAGKVAAAQEALDLATQTGGAPLEWDRLRKLLGDRPDAPETPKEPEEPSTPNPTDDAVRKAAALIEAAKKAAGATEQRTADLNRAKTELANAEQAYNELFAEAARLDALVDAVRRAPSLAARAELGALGDLGPVTLDLPDEGGANVFVDGRPYHMASTGRLVVADAYLRAGLRRALSMPWLPLFIDQVQDVGGQEVPILPPTILLRTTGKSGIEVSRD
jgi:hypothetical protein